LGPPLWPWGPSPSFIQNYSPLKRLYSVQPFLSRLLKEQVDRQSPQRGIRPGELIKPVFIFDFMSTTRNQHGLNLEVLDYIL